MKTIVTAVKRTFYVPGVLYVQKVGTYFTIVTYYKWATTSWTYRTSKIVRFYWVIHYRVVLVSSFSDFGSSFAGLFVKITKEQGSTCTACWLLVVVGWVADTDRSRLGF